ncbi:MAG: hypothetical protein ACP5QG_05075 [candidate division WOR-3 bacterium]
MHSGLLADRGRPSPSTSSPSLGASCSPTATAPTLTITDACPPGVEEQDILPGSGITCSPVSGGLVFNSRVDLGIRIYSVEGRLAYSGNLEKGQNRIPLEQGAYIWIIGAGTGTYPVFKGKLVVR